MLFNLRMEEYLEGILLKIGRRRKETMTFTKKMIKLGYFLLIIKANSKYNKSRNNMLSITIMMDCAYLEMKVMICGLKEIQIIKIIIVQI
jgi:hypothetical protein